MRLRWYLVLAVLAALCPLLAFSAFVVYQNGLAYRTTAEQDLLKTARAVALALDGHFEASIRSLRALAASEHLDKGDLRAFYREAIRTRPAYEEWISISLFDTSGRRLLFSLKPFGTPLPPVPPQMVETFRRLVDTRRPEVSHVFLGPISKRLGFSVGLGVVRDGEVRYVLVAAVDGAVLSTIVARQRVPADWTLTILDPQYVIAARSRTPEVVGQTAGPNLVARARAATSGVFRDVTREGAPAYTAFSRSPTYGWMTSLAVPAATLDAAAMGPLRTVTGVGVALLLGGALLAVWVGGRVSRQIGSIVVEADRLGRGETPEPVPSAIREVADLSASLAAAGRARARAAMEREGTEMKFRALVETAPDAIVIADGLGRIAIVNAQAERMFGYTREELLGRPVEMLLPERVRDAHVHHRAAYHSAPRTRPMGGGLDLLGRRKDGSEIPVEISLSPLQTDGGLLVTSVIRDVTERRRAQDELRRRQREAEELARVGRAVSQSLSPSVATRQIAEGLRQLLPVPVAIVCGLNPGSENMVLLAVAGDDTGAFPAGLVVPWDTGATGLALHEGHVVSSPDILADPRILVAPAARARVELTPYRAVLAVPLILRGTAIGALTACDRPGRVFDQEEIRLAQAFADHATVALENTRLYAEMEQRVTERTADLEAANKELEAFAYSVSHDLRAPLRAMDGFSRMLMDKHAPQLPDEARRYLGVVRKSSQEMGQLIEDLLTFSRLGRQPVERRAVSLSRLAREAFEDLHAEREGRRVELVVGDPPECKADPRFLKQVFVNLLSNALKFTRAREVARIEVGGRREGSEHACFVRDNGVGFDMRYVDKLFGVFQRLHRVEDYEGTGVGLAIVQRIVHRHGGRVWAEGKLDQGATVYFTLEGGSPHA